MILTWLSVAYQDKDTVTSTVCCYRPNFLVLSTRLIGRMSHTKM